MEIAKIVGLFLILAPIIGIGLYVTGMSKQPIPIFGSPIMAIIFWIIGGYLLKYKPKTKTITKDKKEDI